MLTKFLLQSGQPNAAAGQRAVDRVLAEHAARGATGATTANTKVVDVSEPADPREDSDEHLAPGFE